jgi:virulence-associated protein VagC
MSTAEVVNVGGGQVVKLPEEFRLETGTVSIRREGEAVILEPVKSLTWPAGFFEAVRIDDPKFVRPDQDQAPPVPSLD